MHGKGGELGNWAWDRFYIKWCVVVPAIEREARIRDLETGGAYRLPVMWYGLCTHMLLQSPYQLDWRSNVAAVRHR